MPSLPFMLGALCVLAIAVLFIIIVALAGLGLAVVNALRDSAWGIFSIGSSIPLAHEPGKAVVGTVNAGLTLLMMGCVFLILGSAAGSLFRRRHLREVLSGIPEPLMDSRLGLRE